MRDSLLEELAIDLDLRHRCEIDGCCGGGSMAMGARKQSAEGKCRREGQLKLRPGERAKRPVALMGNALRRLRHVT